MSPLNLVLDPIASPGVISTKLWIKEGSRADPVGQKGAHQLLASLLTRGCGPYDNVSLADLVEGCGAGLRCDTNEDGVLISLKCSSNDADQLIPLLGWMMIDPHLNPKQIHLEKELSIQALQRQKENPFHLAFDSWRKLAYGEGPYGHDPLGVSEDLKGLERKELLPLAKSLIQRDSFLVIAGAVNQDLEKQLKAASPFKDKPILSTKGPSSHHTSILNHSSIAEANISLEYQETEQVVIILGKPTLSHFHIEDIHLRLLNSHLGIGMSSILFRQLREEHGVAYEVGAHHPAREGASPFLLHASTSEEKASLTLQLLMEIWNRLSKEPISEKDLSLAKAKFQGQVVLCTQTSSQKAERKAQLKSLNLPDNYDNECINRMKSITSKSLQVAAIKHLSSPLLSLCGPKRCLEALSEQWQKTNATLSIQA